jgi:hypothetical protein
MNSSYLKVILTISIALGVSTSFAAAPASSASSGGAVPTAASGTNAGGSVDTTLEPSPEPSNALPNAFRDMVVVQRRAKEKISRFLFYSYGSFDFSDGPSTMYGLNTNIGYALGDSFEIYANFVPLFVANERDIVKRVRGLKLQDGTQAEIGYSKPKSQYGIEFLWAPAYGKDSWGPKSIVRSDTFFKFQASQIQYEADSGMRFGLSIGKTFFLSRFFNLRLSAGGSYLQTIVEQQKAWYFVGIIETGLVWYL